MLRSTVDTRSASAPGWHVEEFQIFLHEWVDSALEVDSRLLFSEVVAHIVDNDSGMYFTGLGWYLRTSRSVPDDCSLMAWRSMHSRCFGCQAVFPQKSEQCFHEALVAGRFVHSLDVAREDFLGALDDEQFFVVEGSGGGGVAGSLDSKVTCSLHRHVVVDIHIAHQGMRLKTTTTTTVTLVLTVARYNLKRCWSRGCSLTGSGICSSCTVVMGSSNIQASRRQWREEATMKRRATAAQIWKYAVRLE